MGGLRWLCPSDADSLEDLGQDNMAQVFKIKALAG